MRKNFLIPRRAKAEIPFSHLKKTQKYVVAKYAKHSQICVAFRDFLEFLKVLESCGLPNDRTIEDLHFKKANSNSMKLELSCFCFHPTS
jgi:hypothetical protein